MLPITSVVGSFLIASFLTAIIIPKIVKVAIIKNLTDKPGHRKIHSRQIPTLGGIAMFTGFFTSLMLFANGHVEHITIIAASSFMIFVMGIKDDLINMSPRKKLTVEVISALLITTVAEIRITNLHGFLGIDVLPLWISIVLSVLLILFIINTFNLIDGIDGLAASIGILCAVLYGTWFFLAGNIGYTIIAASTAGALCAFLPFNVINGKNKIFMGDTGSLTMGLMLSILTIRFNEFNISAAAPLSFYSPIAISFALLFLPSFDTFRTMLIRIGNKQSPFVGDNNHLHHRLLRLGLTHIEATLILVLPNILFIALACILDKFGTLTVVLSMFCMALFLSYLSLILERVVIRQKEFEYNHKKLIERLFKESFLLKKNHVEREIIHKEYKAV